MIEKIKLNLVRIIKNTSYICGCAFSVVAVVTSFISWDVMKIDTSDRIKIFCFIILISIIFSVIYILFIKRKNVLWKNGNGKLQVCYGNIIKLGEHNNKGNRTPQVIVIPVNTCFDTLVDDDITNVDKPLISPRSIHGQWIIAAKNKGILLEEMDQKIAKSIMVHNLKPVKSYTRQERKRGKLDAYELGTVIPVSFNNNTTYFLVALAELDENNKAQCSEYDFIKGIEKLIDYYNNNGQGFEMFIPLIGTGMSRVNFQHQDALRKMKAIFELYRNKVKGTVNIVIYDKDSCKVSIFD